MADPLLYLTYLGLILLIGIICSIFAKKLRIPNFLLLILVGIVISNITYKGELLIEFSSLFLTSTAILALATIVFDASSRLKIREFDSLSISALKLSLLFILINTIILGFATYLLYKPISPLLVILFATAMSGTSPSAIMTALREGKKIKVFELLEIESIVNTPLVVLIPFLILDIIGNVQEQFGFSILLEQIGPFTQQFVTGIGAGVFIGVLFFKAMKRRYSPTLSPLALIAAAVLTYTIAEHLGGNGVLAVTTMGLFFGNVFIEHKKKLQEFSETFSLILEILVFVLIGVIIKVPLTLDFLYKSGLLFLVFIFVRFISILISQYKKDFNFKEKLFMSLNVPKGIATAVVAFTLAAYTDINGMKLILDLILAFIIYSMILSTVTIRLSKFFVKVEAIHKETFIVKPTKVK
ncbi:NhaP-type Na+(K+)/H+ antiporter [Thermoplasmatales archaeon SCGC AB-539-C06]|nr:NhaP-type Na+(K+)/H+ antiporter [Thermoplasmatales archaeon SCGC AB-539-C06]